VGAVGAPVFGITLGAGGGAALVVASGLLLAVVVRSVLLGVNMSRAPTINAIAPKAIATLHPEPASSNGTLVCRGLFRKDSSYGVKCGKFGSYVMAFPPC